MTTFPLATYQGYQATIEFADNQVQAYYIASGVTIYCNADTAEDMIAEFHASVDRLLEDQQHTQEYIVPAEIKEEVNPESFVTLTITGAIELAAPVRKGAYFSAFLTKHDIHGNYVFRTEKGHFVGHSKIIMSNLTLKAGTK